MNELQKFEADYTKTLAEGKELPEFRAGDTLKVKYRIVEGDKERVQAYQGVCIACKNRGINSSFTVRKISDGEGVERIFPLYSPRIAGIEVVRKGVVRRSKLYYLRELSGKSARITEKLDQFGLVKATEAQAATAESQTSENTTSAATPAEKPAKKEKAKKE